MTDLKSRYEFGWFSAYDTLVGMINIYGIDKVREATFDKGAHNLI